MNKKKILSTGAATFVAISCFATSTFANPKTELKNSMEVNMHVDADGNTVYEYIDVNGVTRTSTTASKALTKGRMDNIHMIMKVDSDDIVVKVTGAPANGRVHFEITTNYGTIASSGDTNYAKGGIWSAKGASGILGVQNNVRARPTVSGTYSFNIQW